MPHLYRTCQKELLSEPGDKSKEVLRSTGGKASNRDGQYHYTHECMHHSPAPPKEGAVTSLPEAPVATSSPSATLQRTLVGQISTPEHPS